ncbi:MAG: hypothetical protein GC206_06035 [Alphaproteobacteria bacterium]|nr:hypothetical protein [Alphaproteobacteria bacterium]
MDAGALSIAEQSAHFLNRAHVRTPDQPLAGPWAWRPQDFAAPPFEPAPDALIAAFEAAAPALEARDPASLTRDDFPFPTEAFTPWRDALERGRGFLLLRGLPVDRWPLPRSKLFLRGLGMQFGRLGVQNPRGDVIGEVRDTGAAQRDAFARNYITDREFRFHCDAADRLGLLCISKAAQGGESKFASSATVFNALLALRPDLAQRLFQPVHLDLRNEQAPEAAPFGEITPCAFDGRRLRTIYISDYFRSVTRHGSALIAPDVSDLYDLYETLAEENAIRFDLEPGDIAIANNHAVLHARSAFQDAPGRTRLLLRFLASVGP